MKRILPWSTSLWGIFEDFAKSYRCSRSTLSSTRWFIIVILVVLFVLLYSFSSEINSTV